MFGGGGGFGGGFGTAAALGGMGAALGGRNMGGAMTSGAIMGDLMDDGRLNGSGGAFIGAAMGAMTAGISGQHNDQRRRHPPRTNHGYYNRRAVQPARPMVHISDEQRKRQMREREERRVAEVERKRQIRENLRDEYHKYHDKYHEIWNRIIRLCYEKKYEKADTEIKNAGYFEKKMQLDVYNSIRNKNGIQYFKDEKYRKYIILLIEFNTKHTYMFDNANKDDCMGFIIDTLVESIHLTDQDRNNIANIKNLYMWCCFQSKYDLSLIHI